MKLWAERFGPFMSFTCFAHITYYVCIVTPYKVAKAKTWQISLHQLNSFDVASLETPSRWLDMPFKRPTALFHVSDEVLALRPRIKRLIFFKILYINASVKGPRLHEVHVAPDSLLEAHVCGRQPSKEERPFI